uniref:H15 domain-containing protein n=1 Tax=Laticauda laticaudata TaxID=8630 RepID=A0A8C5RIV4_LATLA
APGFSSDLPSTHLPGAAPALRAAQEAPLLFSHEAIILLWLSRKRKLPRLSCLAVKSKFWPNTGFQYNIFSLAMLKKSLAASGYNMEKNNSRLKLVLRSLVTKGMLLQIKSTGTSGSFKLNKKQADPQDKATCKEQLAGAKKAKRAAGAAGAKKAVKKPASVRPKKAEKPAKPRKPPLKKKATQKLVLKKRVEQCGPVVKTLPVCFGGKY